MYWKLISNYFVNKLCHFGTHDSKLNIFDFGQLVRQIKTSEGVTLACEK